MKRLLTTCLCFLLIGFATQSADAIGLQLRPISGIVTLDEFVFADGEKLTGVKLHYLTLGMPVRDNTGNIVNAVLLLHGTTGSAATFIQPGFSDALFGAGRPFDLSKTYIVIPDGIGAGGSSKPSDGLRAHFPHYGYRDQINAQRKLLDRIGIKHLQLILGVSMGGMQTWLWGETFPQDMNALVAIACMPTAISGRNMIWREMITQAIRQDPNWQGGDYPKNAPPKSWLKTAMPLFAIMTSNAEELQQEASTRAAAVDLVKGLESHGSSYDANDFLYTFESSADYDPKPRLSAVVQPMLIIDFADDLLNPPELLRLPTAPNFKAVLLPGGPGSFGHQTIAHAARYASTLQAFLDSLPRR